MIEQLAMFGEKMISVGWLLIRFLFIFLLLWWVGVFAFLTVRIAIVDLIREWRWKKDE